MNELKVEVQTLKDDIEIREKISKSLEKTLKHNNAETKKLKEKLKAMESSLLNLEILDNEKIQVSNLNSDEKLLVAKAINVSGRKQKIYGDIMFEEYPVLYSELDNILQTIEKIKKHHNTCKILDIEYHSRYDSGTHEFQYSWEYSSDVDVKFNNKCVM